MANVNRIPLIVNSTANQIQELPTGDHLQLNDSNKLKIGNSGDLEIYHSSSNSILNDAGTGNILLQTGGSTIVEIKSTGVDITGILNASGIINANNTTGSTSTTTGSLVVDGGVGIAENLYVGGSTNIGTLIITDTTDSTDKDTGALIVEGGVGVEKNISIGGQLNLTGTADLGSGDINFDGGSDGLGVVTNSSNGGEIHFVTKNSGGGNSSTIKLGYQKVNFSGGADQSGNALTFEPKGAAPIYGVRAHGQIIAKTVNNSTTEYTPTIASNIAHYRRLNTGEYIITLQNAMPDTNYTVMATPQFSSGTTPDGRDCHVRTENKTTTTFRVVSTQSQSNSDAIDQTFWVMVVG